MGSIFLEREFLVLTLIAHWQVSVTDIRNIHCTQLLEYFSVVEIEFQ